MEKGSLGNAIRKHRICKGYSQEELAELAGITPTHMKHLESEHRKPSIEVLVNLMGILDLSFDALVFPQAEKTAQNEWMALLADCTKNEQKIIQDLILSLKKNRC